jgi:hypothetical protein
MLTPYDEFPVHQTSETFAYIPSTDYAWDEGYYFGVFNPDEAVFLATGFRVNPNTDMIGGYAMINVAGRQTTFRFSRCWRRDFEMCIGPFRLEVVEPLRKLRLVLEHNQSGLAFDIMWEGSCTPYLEAHHLAVSRGRRTTDQSRYSQPGVCKGFICLNRERWEVSPETWTGARDHSWGLYTERPPLIPASSLLPPRPTPGVQRALRFWTCFRSGSYSGFFHLHDDENGVQRKFDDVFGTPFGGAISQGWERTVELASGRHELAFQPGSRLLRRAVLTLEDVERQRWRVEFDIAAPPWFGTTIGYTAGSWKDGGTFHTYHGAEDLATEWDEFDFSHQPLHYVPYAEGRQLADGMNLGIDFSKPVHGIEYLARVTLHAPDGSVTKGAAQIEHFINGPYHPYGFE